MLPPCSPSFHSSRSASRSTVSTGMATPRPPKTVPYSFSRLKDVPRRLVSAPSLPEWMLTSGPTLGTTPIRDAPDLSTRAEGDGSIWEDEDDQRRHPSRGKQRALRPSRPAKQASFRTVRSFKKVYMTEVRPTQGPDLVIASDD